jgi:hypothetical protein
MTANVIRQTRIGFLDIILLLALGRAFFPHINWSSGRPIVEGNLARKPALF